MKHVSALSYARAMRSRPPPTAAIALVAFVVATTVARAQTLREPPRSTTDDRDHSIVFELGIEGDWQPGETPHVGGTFAFEIEPVEHWLELEFGVGAIPSNGGAEMPVDVLFKKPWQFSPTFEFMIGAGPMVTHQMGRERGTFWGAAMVTDFMFWPRKNVGWYVEPGYEVGFRDGRRQHGVGVAAGLLIGR